MQAKLTMCDEIPETTMVSYRVLHDIPRDTVMAYSIKNSDGTPISNLNLVRAKCNPKDTFSRRRGVLACLYAIALKTYKTPIKEGKEFLVVKKWDRKTNTVEFEVAKRSKGEITNPFWWLYPEHYGVKKYKGA